MTDYTIRELRLGKELCDDGIQKYFPLIRQFHKISDDAYIIVTDHENWILHHDSISVIIKEQP